MRLRSCASAVLVLCAASWPVSRAPIVRATGAAPAAQRSLIDRTLKYVGEYEAALQYVIADETSEQWVARADTPAVPRERRTTQGEMFVTYLRTEHQWTVVHDVATVDGRPVETRPDLTALARAAEVSSVARRVFALNARYNLGPVLRNFNDPLLALLPFNDDRRRRFRFSHRAEDRAWEDGQPVATISFKERDRPTLVRDTRGRPVYTDGDVDVDGLTGRVRRAHIQIAHDDIRAELTTVFSYEDRLALWVPTSFVERYTSDRDALALVTTCVSTYSNYRRFEVTGRLR